MERREHALFSIKERRSEATNKLKRGPLVIGEYVLNTNYDVTQLFWRTRSNVPDRG